LKDTMDNFLSIPLDSFISS